jgi:pimeloyl-ACP methyl ester carboxylesterase
VSEHQPPASTQKRALAQRIRRAALIGGGAVLALSLTLVGLLWWWSPGKVRPLRDESGHVVPGSIAEKLHIEVNGVEQGMFLKGMDRSNPVLLWLHGGPGMPDYFLTEQYPIGLEDIFTIAWWDQRGTALSYDPDIPAETMTVERFISDTIEVADYLRDRFDQDRIYLLGHSWGSYVGIQAAARAPDRFHAYIGMAQMAHQLESEKLAYDYMLAEYRDRGDADMVKDFERAPVSMVDGTPQAYLELRDKAMHQLGVGTTRDMDSVITGIFLPSWRFPEFTIEEKIALWRGRAFSRSFGLWDQIIRVDLRDLVPRLEIPVYLMHGVHDYTCSYPLARDYFHLLDAPVKGFYSFEQSAHSPVLEEPARAHEIFEVDVLARETSLTDIP